MFCPKCGKQLNDGMVFCPNCGQKIASNVQRQTAPSQTVNNQYAKAGNEGTTRKILAWAVILSAIVVVVGMFLYLNRGLNLSKFDQTNENSISTSWFKEFASDENNFKSYSCSDYTKSGNASGRYAVLQQQAKSIEHGPLQGIYLLTYENEAALREYAYHDILQVMREGLHFSIAAFKSTSGDFYLFDCTNGGFGSHTYYFRLVGNSMVYAIKYTADDEPDAYEYLLELDTEGMFDLPEFGNYVDFTMQFIEDINQMTR